MEQPLQYDPLISIATTTTATTATTATTTTTRWRHLGPFGLPSFFCCLFCVLFFFSKNLLRSIFLRRSRSSLCWLELFVFVHLIRFLSKLFGRFQTRFWTRSALDLSRLGFTELFLGLDRVVSVSVSRFFFVLSWARLLFYVLFFPPSFTVFLYRVNGVLFKKKTISFLWTGSDRAGIEFQIRTNRLDEVWMGLNRFFWVLLGFTRF